MKPRHLRVRVTWEDEMRVAVEYHTGMWGYGSSPAQALVELAHSLVAYRDGLAVNRHSLPPELADSLALLESLR